eukprot:TRINITY_DN5672_c0_g1_i9.p1 TRINITY_DN5672_c0_g1~~TRINITY_DN5672_c0_g1_i9.p1  ORF type:complete len:843 (-),score=238.21 TRINITY_DN5672_c0_g1_i9:181-2709(-)
MKEERGELREELLSGKYEVVITTYEMTLIEKSALKKFNWQYIVIDEAHRIKNEESQLSQIVRVYSSQYRLLLTGTPLQNNLHELWALLNFLLPSVFSSSQDWEEWFTVKSKEGETEEKKKERGKSVIEKLHKILKPFILRRRKAEVEKGIPPKTEIKVYVRMSPMQREWYRGLLEKDLITINSGNGPKTRLQNILMQLRKVCNHPYLFPGAEPGPPFTEGEHLVQNCGKLVVLDKLLASLKKRGNRVLLFCQMTKALDILEDYLIFRKFSYCRLDGSTDHADRTSQIDEYNAAGSTKFIFLLSTRAGGLGINLATADSVILYDSDWNPQVDLQAQDRAHRIGQTKHVKVYRFVTEGTVEEKIVERAETKLHLDAMVIQQGKLVDQNAGLTKNDVLNMIRFGADAIFDAKEASEITDEDIDAILAYGEKKTKELEMKLKKHEKDMMDWAISGDVESFSVYNFEGVDYKEIKSLRPSSLLTRDRKKAVSYNENDYFRSVLSRPSGKRSNLPGLKKPPQQIVIHPHQFYSKKLQELYDKEMEFWKRRREMIIENDGDVDEEELSQFNLTPEEVLKKQKLTERGFRSWTKRDFSKFIKACADFGRNHHIDIAKAIGNKTIQEVQDYSAVFWKKYKTLPDWESKISQIEKGENKRKRHKLLIRALEAKIERTPQPWLFLDLPKTKTKGKVVTNWTKLEDSFLLCATYKVGYGNWEKVKTMVEGSDHCKFNYFFRSRTPQDFERRCNTLLRIIEKELSEAGVDLTTYAKNRGDPPSPPSHPPQSFLSEHKEEHVKEEKEQHVKEEKNNQLNGPEKCETYLDDGVAKMIGKRKRGDESDQPKQGKKLRK